MITRASIIIVVAGLAFAALFTARVGGQETPGSPTASPAASPGASPVASPVASPGASPVAGDLRVVEGQAIARAMCLTCHTIDGKPLVGPTWKGLYGSTIPLEGGATVVADDAYIRESIVDPMAKIHQGFPPAMPPFGTLLSEEQIQDIIEYIKTLK